MCLCGIGAVRTKEREEHPTIIQTIEVHQRHYESAGKPKGAGTRRGNVFLKSTLFAAASAAVNTKSSYYRDKYNRLRARRGPVRAIMAIAHKLLIAAFHMLSTGEAFRDLGESYLDQVARKRSTTKLVQRLSNLGYDVMLVLKAA